MNMAMVVPLNVQWQDAAMCKGRTELFYPTYYETHLQNVRRETKAKEFCAVCPVRRQCLAHALANDEDDGIWGGTNRQERRKLTGRNPSHRR